MHGSGVTALLSGVVDYAGVFPPAGLAMAAAVEEYARAGASASAWMLGRFVVPAVRLGELADAIAAAPAHPGSWAVSAIVRDGSADDLAAIAAFNAAAARLGALVDSVEAKPSSLDGIAWLATHGPSIGEVYVEVAPGPDVDAWLSRIAAAGLRAKVRTGGLAADAFPAPAALVAFLASAVRRGVPFKATAGLHHALRGAYRFTYAPDSAYGQMYGFLNVLLATAALQAGESAGTAEALLTRSDASSLVFADGVGRWAGHEFPAAALGRTRARHLVSFGSCSFREPVEELDALASR